jgi:ABC-type amino acid transport substrate-binding protein
MPIFIRRAVLLPILGLQLASTLSLEPSQYPAEVRLKAGVLHAPPFAIVEETWQNETGKNVTAISFRGFQIDLLERMKIFAANDGVDLKVELTESPRLYADAFNLLANDCNTTANQNLLEDCQKFDVIIGNYYSNGERWMRADLSPSWKGTSLATIKFTQKNHTSPDLTILAQAEEVGASVCVPKGTYLSKVVQNKFPGAQYIHCDQSQNECILMLKNESCVLYANDEMLLDYIVQQDPTLKLTGESFNAQYLVWPMKANLDQKVSKLLKKWIYDAVQNATVDELYSNYFGNQFCPLGTSGVQCKLPCDPGRSISQSILVFPSKIVAKALIPF